MIKANITLLFAFLLSFCCLAQSADLNGYKLWLNYRGVEDLEKAKEYQELLGNYWLVGAGSTHEIISRELDYATSELLPKALVGDPRLAESTGLILSTLEDLPEELREEHGIEIPEEGYRITVSKYQKRNRLWVLAQNEVGLLYGTFHLLRLLQTGESLQELNILEYPRVKLRLLNHWDNQDRSVERGYAGFSIWNWHTLPDYQDPRYTDYARANASIGINGTVVTNVNSNALILTPQYLKKFKALADIFRPYGIKLYLTARFSAPVEIGGLKTADPLDPEVISWWEKKVAEIYELIPDFGGFLVKANSEGQPGPQNYGRNHLDGANMMAKALDPFGGNVMWRAFVYSEHDASDRAKQAYSEFVPYDGKFRDNVLVQVKNGPIDFQPREPFHPLFGAMPNTPLMMEFQITKEYLGFATHLVYLPRLFEEVLSAQTYNNKELNKVSQIVSNGKESQRLTGMAGVANIGTDLNWTGHPFGQADWFGFGRLSWNPELNSEEIAEEWLGMTFNNDSGFLDPMKNLLKASREAVVSYMNPLGLHHIFDTGHHYGPGPWVDDLSRPEWNPVYYHQADSLGIGFDRTATGSNALSQYAPEFQKKFEDPRTCPDEYLLWFHHLPWDFEMKDGLSLWEALGLKYQEGVNEVRKMQATWAKMQPYVNAQLHTQVTELLKIQHSEAIWWKDACMTYFHSFSKMEYPQGMEAPEHDLEYYKSLKFPFAPGIRPRWN